MRFRSSACLFLLLSPWIVAAPPQTAESPAERVQLTLDRIFGSDDFKIKSFGPTHWHPDGRGYTRLEQSRARGIDGQDIVLYRPGQRAGRVLVSARQLMASADQAPLDIEEYNWSQDGQRLLIFTRSRPVWRQNTRGDYWLLDLRNQNLWQIGGAAEASSLMFAKFSPDSQRVAYVQKNDLYVQNLSDKPEERTITRLTHDGSATRINGTFDWVYEEEFHLRDGFCWSPDSRRIAFWQLDSSRIGLFHLINNTDSLYPRLIPIPYPKAGTANSLCRIGVVTVEGGEPTWIQLPDEDEEHYIPRMDWAASNQEIVLQRMNRLQNRNQLLLCNIQTGQVQTLITEEDEAWLDAVDDLKWLDRGQHFTWVSDRDGWQHIYLVSRDGRTVRCLTPGAYDVIGIQHIDDRSGWVYFIASPDNPTQKYLYRVALDGSEAPERLTPANLPGTHGYRISPDARWAFHTHSRFDTPPQTDLIALPDHALITPLETNRALRTNLSQITPPKVEFFEIDNGEGVKLNAWCLKPADFDPAKRYPLLLYVYGEPWSQTVIDSYGRNYPWYTLLTQKGYLVASIENRGTPQPKGRKWRKCVYRQIGTLASADQSGALKTLLASRPYLDPERVAVWGWSGGGSMTLNLLFRYPKLYRMGMAVAPVPDIRLYDTIYQERYMGLPTEQSGDYSASSPISYAHQLEGDLLIVHGTGDDNVHYQGTERLVNRLIECDKPFTLMAYPNRSHSVSEGQNTTRHLYKLLTRYLLEHNPSGAR